MAKHIWEFVKSKKIFIVLLILYTVVFILAVRFIFHILPILLGGLLGWITAPLCRLLEKQLHLSHKRAALCTAVAVYSVSLVLLALLFTRLIRESAAFFASERYFRYEALAPAVRSFLERTWQELPQWISAAQKNFSGNMGAAMPALQGTVKAILLLPVVFLTLTLIPVFAYLTLLYRENLLSLLKKLIGEKCVENLQKIRKKRIFRRVCFCLCTHLHHHVCGKLCDAPPAAHGISADDCRRCDGLRYFPGLWAGNCFAAARRLPIVMRQRGASTRALHRVDHSKRHSADY